MPSFPSDLCYRVHHAETVPRQKRSNGSLKYYLNDQTKSPNITLATNLKFPSLFLPVTLHLLSIQRSISGSIKDSSGVCIQCNFHGRYSSWKRPRGSLCGRLLKTAEWYLWMNFLKLISGNLTHTAYNNSVGSCCGTKSRSAAAQNST